MDRELPFHTSMLIQGKNIAKVYLVTKLERLRKVKQLLYFSHVWFSQIFHVAIIRKSGLGTSYKYSRLLAKLRESHWLHMAHSKL